MFAKPFTTALHLLAFQGIPAALALLTFGQILPAGAAPLPAAQFTGGDDFTGFFITSPGVYNYNARGDAISINISATANSVSDSQNALSLNTFIQSSGQMVYFYGVFGPPGPNVPILISYGLDTSGTGAYQSLALLNAHAGSAADTILCSGSGNGGCPSGSIVGPTYSATVATDIPANTPVEMSIAAITTIGPDMTAFASVDPFIEIDPTFADAGLYTLEFSAGVSNGAPPSKAPEPCSLVLFGTGVAGLGFVRRRKPAPAPNTNK